MQHQIVFLADLTVALAAAALGGGIAARCRVNPIIGYLFAGIAIGPFTPGYVAHGDTLDTLATLGLIFLLFSLGLGFSFEEIRKLGAIALAGNAIVMGIIGATAALATRALGFAHASTIGLIVVVSSTAVGAGLLRGWKIENAGAGRFALAQLIVQDFAAVALLVIVTTPTDSLSAIGIAIPVIKAVGFVAIALVLGATVLHALVKRVLRTTASESLFPLFAALAMVAAWLGHLAGLSFEFGAFVAGAVISEAAGSRMVVSVVAPFRSLFVALFFVSVGMLIDPNVIGANWPLVFGGGTAFVVFRLMAWGVLARLSGIARSGATLAALTMTALGEFNVVLVNEAQAAHRIDSTEAQLLLGVTFFSIVLCILIAPAVAKLARTASDSVKIEGLIEQSEPLVAIIGFGRVGRTVGAVLQHASIPFAALDQSREAVSGAREAGYDVIVGDGADPNALDQVVRASTRLIIITLPDFPATLAIMPRLLATGVDVIARGSSGVEATELRRRGAKFAFVPESEGALLFARVALEALGLERGRIEQELDAERERSPALATTEPRDTGSPNDQSTTST